MIQVLLLGLMLTDPLSWKEFSEWFRKEGKPGAAAEVLKAYGEKLQSAGVPDVEKRTAEVREYMNTHPKEALTLHFDRIYTWADAPFSRQPSQLLMKVASGRKPGRALDIAMGQGRNAVWLASQGWQVSGYDMSGEAIRQARAAAAAAGVALDTQVASHEEFALGEAQWDLIVMSFAFTKLSDQAYMKAVRASLKPGGVLLVEGFNGGPKQENNLVLKAFMEYRVLLFEDLPDVADWGKVKAPILRMALELP